MEHADIVTLNELSAYLKIPKGTLYKLCENGSIPNFKVGKQLRFRKSAVDRWIVKKERKKKIGRSRSNV